jgi:hypothetical protein
MPCGSVCGILVVDLAETATWEGVATTGAVRIYGMREIIVKEVAGEIYR